VAAWWDDDFATTGFDGFIDELLKLDGGEGGGRGAEQKNQAECRVPRLNGK
jgi:hypothetical protein